MALVNEQNQHSGFQPVGFANPVLYGLGKSNLASKYFTDIHDGSATNSYTPGTDSCKFPADTLNGPGFSTVTGYDLATGWGSPKCGLINQLASLTPLPVRSISAGFEHTCAVRSDHTVQCWGDNGAGQLGDGTTIDRNTPVTVTGISTAAAVSAGALHSCALLANGTIQCWGINDSGQLGNGSTNASSVPVTVSGISTAIAVSTTWDHTCAALASGGVQCWGANACGQLGDGTTTDSTVPTTVYGIVYKDPLGVAAGVDHTCAWTAAGYVYCWGCNDLGQLGNGTTTNSSVATLADSSLAYPISAVSSGSYYSCALAVNGTVYCWGWNNYGTLGIGTNGGVFDFNWLPIAVLGISSATGVAAGGYNTCATLADGTVQCWGLNDNGELGNGSTGGIIPSPVTVSGLSQAAAVTVGSMYSCAMSPGAVNCWGWNQNGELGNGTNTDSSTPTPVTFH